jgi:small subunit ribosomal protein S35
LQLTEKEWKLEHLARDVEKLDPVVQAKAAMEYLDQFELENEEKAKDVELPEMMTTTQMKEGFWAEGEEDGGPDEDYYGDDITSLGHGRLEEHRELREYARLAAWELPLLSQLAKPFELPTVATPFRFRYTSYLGEKHPATNKVVVEFQLHDIQDMTLQQKDKLIKLAGPRFKPDTGFVKMSCEMFDTQDQNKRFLAETIKKLLDEARDPKDTFADVPFDFRYHKMKPKYEFPQEWALTPERKQYLEEKRRKQLESDYQRGELGTIMDGQKVVQEALPNILPTVPEMATVPAGRLARRMR